MKRLLTAVLATFLGFASYANEKKDILIVCKGNKATTYRYKNDQTSFQQSPITKTYSFKYEQNPRRKDELDWSMQTDGAGWEYQQELPVRLDDPAQHSANFNILLLDHSIFVQRKSNTIAYKDRSGFQHLGMDFKTFMKINRLSGDWTIESNNYYSDGSYQTTRISGSCEAAQPRF